MVVSMTIPSSSAVVLDYPIADRPASGTAISVMPGIFWVRMPIPIPGLDFINLWALEDGNGWTLIDSGFRSKEIRAHWDSIHANELEGRPVRRVLCTHFHPDHLGEAGTLCRKFDAPLWMTLGEWSFARMLSLDAQEDVPEDVVTFYRRMGVEEASLTAMRARGFNNFAKGVTEIPRSFHRIKNADVIKIGQHDWRVMVGQGHSPEHACLYSASLGALISGDQVLPRITPHIGVYPGEPNANPLKLYLESLAIFQPLPQDTLVLPSHGDPFRGLHVRLDQLSHHHEKRLNALVEVCETPKSVVELLPVLFRRALDDRSIFMAAGEALAHLHLLIEDGRLQQAYGDDGIIRFFRRPVAAAA